MYEQFYGFREKPFNLTPDPCFLYLSEKHKEAFAHLLYGIRNRSGFIMVTGEIGTGKTTICRSLLSRLDPDTEVAFIFNPILSAEELIRTINEDFGIDSQAESIKGLIDELNAYLLKKASERKNCVLVIDEAQNLEPKVLEQVRLLSNLETETEKLLQIVLIGQPELGEMLARPDLRQLNQRITARYHLRELNANETLHYIAFRLRIAGGRRKVRFSRAAVMKIYRHSKGTPRVINAICDRALLIGYTKETREITPVIVRQAINEIRGEKVKIRKRKEPSRLRPTMVTAGGIALAAVIGMLVGLDFAAKAPAPHPLATPPRVAASFPEPKIVQAAPVPLVAPEPVAAEPEPVTEPAAESETAPPRELPPADLAEILRATTAGEANRAALTAILAAWGREAPADFPAAGDAAALAAFAKAQDFEFLRYQATLDQVLAINLPVYLLVRAGDETRPVALVGADNGDALLACQDAAPVRSPLKRLGEVYTGEAAYLWADPSPGARNAIPWQTGAHIRELQEQLRSIGLTARKPNGSFDAPLIDLIRKVQNAVGINVDGVVGEHTRMVLASWDANRETPALSAPCLPDATRDLVLARAAPPSKPRPAPAAEEPKAEVALVPEQDEPKPDISQTVAAIPDPKAESSDIEREGRAPALRGPLPDTGVDPEALPVVLEEAIASQAKETRTAAKVEAQSGPRVETEDLERPAAVSLLEADADPPQKRATPPAEDHVPLIPRNSEPGPEDSE